MPIVVPYDTLSEETLGRVIEEFVSRAGTDYGAHEKTLDEKIADVRRQLVRGEATIIFDPETEHVDIVLADRL